MISCSENDVQCTDYAGADSTDGVQWCELSLYFLACNQMVVRNGINFIVCAPVNQIITDFFSILKAPMFLVNFIF